MELYVATETIETLLSYLPLRITHDGGNLNTTPMLRSLAKFLTLSDHGKTFSDQNRWC